MDLRSEEVALGGEELNSYQCVEFGCMVQFVNVLAPRNLHAESHWDPPD